MQRVTKRCPHCNALVGYHKGVRLGVGYPIKQCPSCGSDYIDSEVHEWETMKESQKIFYLSLKNQKKFVYPLPISIFFIILFSVFLSIILINIDALEEFVFIPIIVTFVFFFLPGSLGILNYVKSKKILSGTISDREIVESVKRTSDIDYREFLMKNGVKFYPLDNSQYDFRKIENANESFEESIARLDDIYKSLKSKYNGESKPIIEELSKMLKTNEIDVSQHQYIISKVFNDILKK